MDPKSVNKSILKKSIAKIVVKPHISGLIVCFQCIARHITIVVRGGNTPWMGLQSISGPHTQTPTPKCLT